VVASRTSPVEEVVTDGVTGRLVDFFDPGALAETLTDVLARPMAYRAMREAARAHVVENYDLHGLCLPRLVEFVESWDQ